MRDDARYENMLRSQEILRGVLDNHLKLIGDLTKAVTALAERIERLESQHKRSDTEEA